MALQYAKVSLRFVFVSFRFVYLEEYRYSTGEHGNEVDDEKSSLKRKSNL